MNNKWNVDWLDSRKKFNVFDAFNELPKFKYDHWRRSHFWKLTKFCTIFWEIYQMFMFLQQEKNVLNKTMYLLFFLFA